MAPPPKKKHAAAITSSIFALITLGLLFSLYLISSDSTTRLGTNFYLQNHQLLQNGVVVVLEEEHSNAQQEERPTPQFSNRFITHHHNHNPPHHPHEQHQGPIGIDPNPTEPTDSDSSEESRIQQIIDSATVDPGSDPEVQLTRIHTTAGGISNPTTDSGGEAPEKKNDTSAAVQNISGIGLSRGANASSSSSESHPDEVTGVCKDRYVYIYELPREFNEDLVDKCGRVNDTWDPMCGNLNNFGYGPLFTLNAASGHVDTNSSSSGSGGGDILVPPHAWFFTEQFTSELLFHQRLMKSYPCVTRDPGIARLFFLPFYAAMDSALTLFSPRLHLRDRLTQRLAGWLAANPTWHRFKDQRRHFMVLGRTTWDFSRSEDADDGWGTSFSSQPEFSHVTKLLIERNTWKGEEVGIPYPTSFHPSSDQDIELWQSKVRSSKREFLCSFIGSKSRGSQWSKDLRVELSAQCETAENGTCKQVTCGGSWLPNTIDCTKRPDQLTSLFLSSTFCFQPPGDTPTRKSFFDSLIAGCIPVLFSKSSAYDQYLWHLPRNGSLYSVLFDGDDVINRKVDVIGTLANIATDAPRLRGMQAEIARLLPRLIYALPHNSISNPDFRDAVDVSIDNLLREPQ